MNISVIGTGYVGLTVGLALAQLGHEVICHDIDEKKIAALQDDRLPFYDQTLDEMLNQEAVKERIKFTTSLKQTIDHACALFITVGTPEEEDGRADTTAVYCVIKQILNHVDRPLYVILKSTVPPGTVCKLENMIQEEALQEDIQIIANPEFLRQGRSVEDFLDPFRIIVGARSRSAKKVMHKIYSGIDAPIVEMSPESAELTKYASNAFLATRISFINEMAEIAEKVGADIEEVSEGLGKDSRIGEQYLNAGIGFGGSCLPKDVKAIINLAEKNNYTPHLLKATFSINEKRIERVVEKLSENISIETSRIGVLGLAFKPGTDDVRNSKAIMLVETLLHLDAKVKAYDPKVRNLEMNQNPDFHLCKSPYEVARGVDAVIIATEWNELLTLDFERILRLMRGNVVFDGRNVLCAKKLMSVGFKYVAFGRLSSAFE